eukprot:SAG11_NODE_2760_length_3003_cov_3.626722_1_plen_63_part_00
MGAAELRRLLRALHQDSSDTTARMAAARAGVDASALALHGAEARGQVGADHCHFGGMVVRNQ